jgi:energy coupling factor transporter S component ThiW
MKNEKTKKLVLAGVLTALAVAGSLISIAVGASKCSPVQHLVNVVSAVMLGPWWSLLMAFLAALIRNLLGMGTLFAFPGSMCGALLAGLMYKYGKKLPFALIGELVGTGIIGAILTYPIATFIMGKETALFAMVIPFSVSSLGGVIIASVILYALRKTGKV